MNRDELAEYFDEVIKKARKLLIDKNHDYAGGGDVFANFTRVESLGITSTEKGMLVRMSDKLSRLSSFCEQGNFQVNESLEDTCVDIINYAFLLLAYFNAQSAGLPKVSIAQESEDTLGVVYFATGFKDNGRIPILEEVIQSAESLKKHSPNLPITVYTDEPVDRPELFDNIFTLEETIATRTEGGVHLFEMSLRCQDYRQQWMVFCGWKLFLASISPYSKTLYLDSDTLILNPIEGIFNSPNDFMAAADGDDENIIFNGGLFYFNDEGREFVKLWARQWYEQANQGNLYLDQYVQADTMQRYRTERGKELDWSLIDYQVWNVRPNLANEMPVDQRDKVHILHSRFHILDEDTVWKPYLDEVGVEGIVRLTENADSDSES